MGPPSGHHRDGLARAEARHGRGVCLMALTLGLLAGCPRPAEPDGTTGHVSTSARATTASAGVTASAATIGARLPGAPPSASVAASAVATGVPSEHRGPLEPLAIPFGPDRTAYVVLPRRRDGAARLIAGLHGVCNPPEYACGYWIEAAAQRGLLICPTGNARCGPAMGRAPTWTQSAPKIDVDLEAAIAAVEQAHPELATRDGAILMGFSRGAYAAVKIAAAHPGRWPHLVLIEANVSISAASLGQAGVRSVALIAGERSGQLRGQRRTAEQLVREGFAAKLWVMPGAGHHYSADIDTIMAAALDFVVSPQPTAGP